MQFYFGNINFEQLPYTLKNLKIIIGNKTKKNYENYFWLEIVLGTVIKRNSYQTRL